MKSIKQRMVIYAKDVERITGRRPRTCYTILEKVRKHYGKRKDDFVTVQEFAAFLNLDEQLVKEYLSD